MVSGHASRTTARSNGALRTSGFVARPDAGKSLSDGVVVEASVVARLLGLKLLRLEANVTLLPADVEPITYVEPAAVEVPPDHGGTLGDAVDLLAHASKTMRTLRS